MFDSLRLLPNSTSEWSSSVASPSGVAFSFSRRYANIETWSSSIFKLMKIDELHVSMFAYLLEKLKATPDGDATLLDHSLVLFGSSLSESNIHTHDDLPIVLAGTASGQLKGNRHLVYSKETPLNNLFLNMFDLAGLPHIDGFGDSTGRLANL